MESLKALLDREREAGQIILIRDEIPEGHADALCVRGHGMQNVTVIDIGIDCQARVNELDAHELGHHVSTVTLQHIFAGLPLNLFAMDPDTAGKFEARADRTAASITVSPERIIEAYAEGCREPYEFAEALEITEKAYLAGIELQRGRYGTRQFYHLGYRLTFEPLAIESAS